MGVVQSAYEYFVGRTIGQPEPTHILFLPDGTLATGTYRNSINLRLWSCKQDETAPNSNLVASFFRLGDAAPISLQLIPDGSGRVIFKSSNVASGDKYSEQSEITILDPATRERKSLRFPFTFGNLQVISAQTAIISLLTLPVCFHVIDINTGSILRTITQENEDEAKDTPSHAFVLSDGRLVIGAGRTIFVYTTDFRLQLSMLHRSEAIQQLALLPGDRIASVCDKMVKIWDSRDGSCLQTIPHPSSLVTEALVCSGQLVLVCIGSIFTLNDDQTAFVKRHTLPMYQPSYLITATDGGDLVAVAGSTIGEIKIFNVFSGELVRTVCSGDPRKRMSN